jgi:1-acyl-sn-glycerol-3-phosphate acyltransferase
MAELSEAHNAFMAQTALRGPALQRAARTLLRTPVHRLWPSAISGYESVPKDGPAVLCANHLSFFDSVLMMMTLDRPVYFIGKADYLNSWRTRRLFPALGMIPIDRDNGTRAMLALDAAAEVLRNGALLCVYPEGTRSRDGHLHRGYIGAARVAMTVGCPILPVGIVGTREIQPPGARLPRPGPCSISIGAPLVATDVEVNSRRSAARALTNEVMQRIAELSGQKYIAEHTSRAPVAESTAHRSRARRRRPHVGVLAAPNPLPA